MVEALRDKTEGRGRRWNFSLAYSSGSMMVMGSTQLLTEMNTRDISRGVKTVGMWS